jgi:hypothetical protein
VLPRPSQSRGERKEAKGSSVTPHLLSSRVESRESGRE